MLSFDDIQNHITEKIPISSSVLGRKDWEKIKDLFIARYPSLQKQKMNSCIFVDYLIGCFGNGEQKSQCEHFIDGFNSAVIKANSNVGKDELLKNGIRKIVRELFVAGDDNISSDNSDFKNRLNELLAFNFLNSGCAVNVVAIEEELDNGNRVDFVVKNLTTNECRGFDVVTLQGVDPSKQDNDETMNAFISNRIEKKREDKFGELSSSGRISYLYVMPIIEWNDGLSLFHFKSSNPCSTPIFTNSLCVSEGRNSLELCEINEYINRIHKAENNG